MATIIRVGSSAGNAQIYDLGTGTSFDVTEYAGYKNFTADNFICEPVQQTVGSWGSVASGANSYVPQGRSRAYMSKTYDASTGILSSQLISQVQVKDDIWRGTVTSATYNVHAYLVIYN